MFCLLLHPLVSMKNTWLRSNMNITRLLLTCYMNTCQLIRVLNLLTRYSMLHYTSPTLLQVLSHQDLSRMHPARNTLPLQFLQSSSLHHLLTLTTLMILLPPVLLAPLPLINGTPPVPLRQRVPRRRSPPLLQQFQVPKSNTSPQTHLHGLCNSIRQHSKN